MRQTTSLRLPGDLRERLARAAERQGISLTALVERYAQEGLDTDAHPGIVFKPGPAGRRAALAGTDGWVVGTENAVDFAQATACTVLLVRKAWWPGNGMAAALADSVDRWARDHPDPGHWAHWLEATYR